MKSNLLTDVYGLICLALLAIGLLQVVGLVSLV